MKKKIFISYFIFLYLTACEPYFSGLDIKNDHQPDISTVMGDINQYPSLISGAYNNWWHHMLASNDGDTWILATNSDAFTAGAGNWDLQSYYYRRNYEKPMIPNTDKNAGFPRTLWYNHYSKISTVRNMLATIKENQLVYQEDNKDQTFKILANCYFLMGAFYTELSLLFDQCFLITEDSDLQSITADNIRPALETKELALGYLDQCIEICNAHSFTNFGGLLPSDIVGNNVKLRQFANFMAARSIAYHPRNKDMYGSVDWAEVKKYIAEGLSEDVKAKLPLQGWDVWSYAAASWPGGNQWGRVGMRVINMMAYPGDPGAIWPLPTDFGQGQTLPEADSPDFRLGTDFVYYPSVNTPTGGLSYDGYTKYSSYVLNRFSETGQQSGEGDLYFFTKAESDLLYAEAALQTSEISKAIQMVNLTRVNRGRLNDIDNNSSKEKILEAIYYERFVECGYAYTATPFYDRRRTPIDKFQLTTRSFRQLPIPILELGFYDIESYTFGGEQDKNDQYEF
ncbi:RagB/SusD family nutrient uptake outer membrane protein [Proteiniphilum sp. X52]|uniref:RagB/SusD family nutrient uptake outer membrane protein n=1 Tax=Proteiniphilum sp. X52 TaxID=2382159 RepID=UPI000F0A7BDD|nr:RagB/SusD family nutrient uptake outer membrane protein [Proteiniphilum sp. X52]RNC66173.1 RagB/SusD family nutrient uptake outer membrane protein [Proteiniphilum sp. X52]